MKYFCKHSVQCPFARLLVCLFARLLVCSIQLCRYSSVPTDGTDIDDVMHGKIVPRQFLVTIAARVGFSIYYDWRDGPLVCCDPPRTPARPSNR